MAIFQPSQNVKIPQQGLGSAIFAVAIAILLGFTMIFFLWLDRENLAAKKAEEEARRQAEIQRQKEEQQRRQEEWRRQQEERQRIQIEQKQEMQVPKGAFLGVYYTPVTPALQEAYNLPVDYGVWVGMDSSGQPTEVAVVPNSPAEKAGIQRGDIITTLNGLQVTAFYPLETRLKNYEPGDKITLAARVFCRRPSVRMRCTSSS